MSVHVFMVCEVSISQLVATVASSPIHSVAGECNISDVIKINYSL